MPLIGLAVVLAVRRNDESLMAGLRACNSLAAGKIRWSS